MNFTFEFKKNQNFVGCTSANMKDLTQKLAEGSAVDFRVKITELGESESVKDVGLYLVTASSLGEFDQVTSISNPDSSLNDVQSFGEDKGLFVTAGNDTVTKFTVNVGANESSRIIISEDNATYENDASVEFKLRFVADTNFSAEKMFIGLETSATRAEA